MKTKIKFLSLIGFLALLLGCSDDEAVEPANNNPNIADQIFSIAENATTGTSLGFVSATDPDGDQLNYSIIAGNGDGIFEINSQSGELLLAGALDLDITDSYDLTVEVADSESNANATVTVNVEPLDPAAIPFQELYDQGIDRYLGMFTPVNSVSGQSAPGVTEYLFSNLDGPVCFTGTQFAMYTRDGSNNNLLVFLQGGGFCSPSVCEAVEEGIPYIPLGILNPTDSRNPVSNYNVGYIPYCDGSMMSGDNEVDSDGDGENDRFFKGLQNLSASLDVIAQQYTSPEKIVLAGNSAGGYAVHIALPLVRKLYPEARIYVINDSGQGIGSPGGFEGLFNYWDSNAFIPSSCTDCIGEDGNLTGLHDYQITKDPNIRMAYISSKQDSVTSVAIGGPAFEAELLEAASELNTAHPDRFQSLLANGEAHTYLLRSFDLEIGGISVRQWVSDMINESEDWETVIE